ncbi:MAG TPA: NADH-ubiquinone oxidoreductase-F iron-sulfur binding region domain-containing protein [Pseudonocardiaceae bacterium]|jgi:NADH:ubiquinone oxidoreductase subunit F (NADH-binding)
MTRVAPATVRLLAGWRATGRPADFAEHLDRYGPLPLSEPLIDRVAAARLVGRGGAGFPTAVKLRAVAAGRRNGVVVANGCESEPASRKDNVLLSVAPHLVFDGAQLAARAVGATSVLLCVHQDDPLAATVATALAQRRGDPVPTQIVEVPARFVASEESALVNFINTGLAKPTTKPPRPYERGVRGRPTLVDNVETLANLALIARDGEAANSKLVTVGGAVRGAGVHEVAVATKLRAVLATAGGETEPLQAVLAGGYGGSWLPYPAAADLPLTHKDFRGVGLLLALPARACGIAETAAILGYLADESARQCGPCMFGLPAIADDLALLARGRADKSTVRRLRGRLGVISGRGACAHPDGAVRLAASALHVFERDVHTHAMGRPCVFAADRPRFGRRP